MVTLPAARSDFLDRIRVSLTALVILHHSAIMFGAPGGWYLRMPTTHMAEVLPFTLFAAINQSFFMGFFFLLAGYFSVASYDRKGPLAFARDRLVRLGLPILAYGFVIAPLTIALAGMRKGEPFLFHWTAMVAAGEFEIGPLWFAWALLLFSFAYLAWRLLDKRAGQREPFVPGHGALLLAALATGALAFLLRLWVPVGQARWSLQLGYFASYIVLFAGGCVLARSRWLERIEPGLANPWRLVSLVTAPLLLVYAVLAGALRGSSLDISGGWTFPALAYAFWEPFVAWGIVLGMLRRYRVAPAPSPRWNGWSRSAFAAYIIHPPVVVALGVLLASAPFANSLKFALAGTCAVVLSFVLARAILKVPGVGRVV